MDLKEHIFKSWLEYTTKVNYFDKIKFFIEHIAKEAIQYKYLHRHVTDYE